MLVRALLSLYWAFFLALLLITRVDTYNLITMKTAWYLRWAMVPTFFPLFWIFRPKKKSVHADFWTLALIDIGVFVCRMHEVPPVAIGNAFFLLEAGIVFLMSSNTKGTWQRQVVLSFFLLLKLVLMMNAFIMMQLFTPV